MHSSYRITHSETGGTTTTGYTTGTGYTAGTGARLGAPTYSYPNIST